MNFEDWIDDFMLFISVYLHVNWKLEWFNYIAQMLTLKFQIWSFKKILNEIIKIKDDDIKSWIITNWMIIIKVNKSKVTWKQQFINDFSELEWKKILLTLTEKKATDYTIKIKINVKIEKFTHKRSAEIISEDSDVNERSCQRCTCIDQFLNWAQIKADTLADVNNFNRALLNYWQCNDEHCKNQNDFCFMNFANKHYNMNHIQQSLWDKMIFNNKANISIEWSSISLYNFWSNKQSSVILLSCWSDLHEKRLNVKAEWVKKKDFMTRFMRFNEQQMKMQMSETMTDQIEWMNSHQKASESYSSSQQSSLSQWSSLSLILDYHLLWWRFHRSWRRLPWHVDSLSALRSIRHQPRTSTKRSRAQYFLWHESSSRSRQLQRFRNHGKRRRFDFANVMRNIDGFDGVIAQLPSPSPARIDSCARTTSHTLRGILVALN